MMERLVFLHQGKFVKWLSHYLVYPVRLDKLKMMCFVKTKLKCCFNFFFSNVDSEANILSKKKQVCFLCSFLSSGLHIIEKRIKIVTVHISLKGQLNFREDLDQNE